MSEAIGLKAGVCPHSQDPVTICDICLLRRADKVRLAEEKSGADPLSPLGTLRARAKNAQRRLDKGVKRR